MKRRLRLTSRRGRRSPDDCPLAFVEVWTRFEDFQPIKFCFDTGADVSALSIPIARKEGIEYPTDATAGGTASGLVGSVRRQRGVLIVRIAGRLYQWPCDFLDTAGPATVAPYGVIGRAGFADDFAFCMNKPYFTLRRRKFWTLLLPPWTPEHDTTKPL